MIDILEEVRKEQGELVALRRHFHEHPELSKKEDQTLAYIAKKLEEYGISYRQVDLLSDGAFDYEGIKATINEKTHLVTIQRSKG